MSERDDQDLDPRDDAWLFDRGPAPDAASARIERLLALQRPRQRAARPRAAVLGARLLAAALVLATLGAAWFAFAGRDPGYRFWNGEYAGQLRAGSLLAAGEGGARLEVPGLGQVLLGQGARLVAREASGDRHRFFLERGTLEATITAEPGAFGVDTPAGSSVDLGCLYRLDVAADGATRLAVQVGRVSFEHAPSGREVYVPAGASCLALVGRGPGSPAWDDAAEDWRALVARLDFAGDPLEGELARVAASDDTLALWHLLEAPAEATRARAYERLASLSPPPSEATRKLLVGQPPASGAADAARLAWLERMDWFSYAF